MEFVKGRLFNFRIKPWMTNILKGLRPIKVPKRTFILLNVSVVPKYLSLAKISNSQNFFVTIQV